jgi:hypothetical protein
MEKIFIVIYTHKHGVDAWAGWTRQGVLRSIVTLICEYEDDLEPAAWQKVSRLIQQEKLAEAIEVYEENHPSDERFEIREGTLGPKPEES